MHQNSKASLHRLQRILPTMHLLKQKKNPVKQWLQYLARRKRLPHYPPNISPPKLDVWVFWLVNQVSLHVFHFVQGLALEVKLFHFSWFFLTFIVVCLSIYCISMKRILCCKNRHLSFSLHFFLANTCHNLFSLPLSFVVMALLLLQLFFSLQWY